MALSEKIEQDYIQAYKNKEELKTSLLRLLKSSIKNAEIAKMEKLSDDEILKVIQREIKQRQESAKEYQAGGRADLAEKENQEIQYLAPYMPKELNEKELTNLVASAITETGASSLADFGRVMGAVMPKIARRSTGDKVSAEVKKQLS